MSIKYIDIFEDDFSLPFQLYQFRNDGNETGIEALLKRMRNETETEAVRRDAAGSLEYISTCIQLEARNFLAKTDLGPTR